MITVDKADTIKGWMSLAELKWLADQASRHYLIVEVGSYFGRSTRALGDNALGKVIAVDTWVGPIALNDRSKIASFEQQFRENLADLISSDKVVPYNPSCEILNYINPDMVFIDGDHQYQQVKSDLIFWLARLKKGGLLCGHDFSCLDVARAVGELVRDPEPVLGTDIWFTYV